MLKKFQHDREIAGFLIFDYGLWEEKEKGMLDRGLQGV
jgi:hypothetical protein